ncbi:MAG: hypothetical protein ACO3X1_16460, partial [Burkholderiaceae bacterium]
MPAITSPDSAMSIMRSIAPPDTPGILFTDSQQRVSAFVPIKPEEANSLRIDQRFDRLVNAASEAGAGAAIIANPDAAIDFDGQSNLATALARLDIRLLDVIDVASRTSAVNQGHMPRDQGTVNDLSRKALERRMRHAFEGYEAAPTPKVQAARRLQGLIAKLDDGSISPQDFEVRVRRLAGELDEVVQTKASKRAVKPRQRGEQQLRERLIRAQRQGDLEPETVAFAFWALDQNPALATNLAISIQTPKSEGTAGQYNPTVELMRLFKGADARETAVHELLHHAERMMPKAMQEGIRQAWAQAYTRALEVAGSEERQALSLVPLALEGDRSAHVQLQAAILDGPLNYADHYQLVNPSEYWAVNASALLARRFDAKDSIFKQI